MFKNGFSLNVPEFGFYFFPEYKIPYTKLADLIEIPENRIAKPINFVAVIESVERFSTGITNGKTWKCISLSVSDETVNKKQRLTFWGDQVNIENKKLIHHF